MTPVVLTVEKAKEIKEILDTIKEVLPGHLVDYVFVHWQRHLHPEAGKPCSSCNGKQWVIIINELRQLVDTTIATENINL